LIEIVMLTDRVVLVTGAGQGIGRAIALEMAHEGASVAVLDIQPDRAQETAALCGECARAFPLDITDYAAFAAAVDAVIAWRGQIDALVNNAGIFTSGTILEDRPDDWRRTMCVNLEALYMGTKLVVPHMVARRYGRIINIASIAGYVSRGNVGSYNASKGAVIAYTKSLAVELGQYGIQANAIAPGFMRTAMMMSDGVDLTTEPEFQDWYVGRGKIPLRRAGVPEDVAGAAVFLASPYCRYMTGAVLVVDGGLTSTF
jgi:NAD(P)-dependent dehydrogenase (short-subunit alcohol dehydrogenase family)